VRSWGLFVELLLEPRLGFMVLSRWTVPIATGRMDAVFFSTALALIESVTIVPALAVWDGEDTHPLHASARTVAGGANERARCNADTGYGQFLE
jgi:hypothetical protein